MKFQILWKGRYKPSKFSEVMEDKTLTMGPLIISEPFKIPSYILDRCSYKPNEDNVWNKVHLFKNITEENLKKVEEYYIDEWDGEWKTVSWHIAALFNYPTAKRKSLRQILSLINGEGYKYGKFVFLKEVDEQHNYNIELDINNAASKIVKLLINHKWKRS